MSIRIAVPKPLMCVANGNLREIIDLGDFQRYDWFVSYPINNYNVTVNIARYAHFSDTYTALDGDTLRLDYYVLPNNLAKARQHFKQVPKVLACFERYFGKYPFWRDGYALVETPYLGMEHQGAIAYGNQYMRGYLGGMIPRDMNWDYIIVHETAHEYFGNSVSCGDLAEMWIHESFATYMEALYVECAYSYRDAVRYLVGQRLYIANQEPIIGPFDVNWENWTHSDHYFKGAWMLHTLRHAINDDMKWWDLLRGFYDKHALSIATTEDFARYVNACTDEDYNAFFDQYLRYAELPTFEYELEEKGKHLKLRYRWRAGAPGFAMPILVGRADEYTRVKPTSEWQETTLHNLRAKDFRVPLEYFLIQARRL
jgi:aminopeptidase N